MTENSSRSPYSIFSKFEKISGSECLHRCKQFLFADDLIDHVTIVVFKNRVNSGWAILPDINRMEIRTYLLGARNKS